MEAQPRHPDFMGDSGQGGPTRLVAGGLTSLSWAGGDGWEGSMSAEMALHPVPLAVAGSFSNEADSALPPVYLPGPPGRPPILYRQSGLGIGHLDVQRLQDSGVPFLLVDGEHLDGCERALERKLDELMQDPALAPEQKAACVHTVGLSVARGLLNLDDPGKHIDRAAATINSLIGAVLSDEAVSVSLLQMSAHHRSTASHMFAVSFLAILLGAEVFGSRSRELKDLGSAGMLHDLGKTSIPGNILNKKKPLTAEEIELIRQHPIESVRLIGRNPAISAKVREVILQHHERPDGKGYPLGLIDEKLLPATKVLSLVDVFHALIGARQYRARISPVEAVRIQGLGAGSQFDRELYTIWRRVFGRHWTSVRKAPDWMPEESDSSGACHGDHKGVPVQNRPRRNPRLHCEGKVEIKCVYVGRLCIAEGGPFDFTAQLHDLSRSGFCMYCSRPMYCGEIVHALINSEGSETWVRGLVRWCKYRPEDQTHRVGVRFEHRIDSDSARDGADMLSLNDPRLFSILTESYEDEPPDTMASLA